MTDVRQMLLFPALQPHELAASRVKSRKGPKKMAGLEGRPKESTGNTQPSAEPPTGLDPKTARRVRAQWSVYA